ncbi:MAG: response regulator [bacterium]|nr:response regulator [bacterium]
MKTPRILIADDVPYNRTLLHHLVKKFGDCDFAANGIEVLAAVEAAAAEGRPYDLILLDIMMPEMDGQEALSELRKREAQAGVRLKDETKVVMVTSLGDWDNVLQGFKKGVVEYLVKPIRDDNLRELLAQMGFQPLTAAGK